MTTVIILIIVSWLAIYYSDTDRARENRRRNHHLSTPGYSLADHDDHEKSREEKSREKEYHRDRMRRLELSDPDPRSNHRRRLAGLV